MKTVLLFIAMCVLTINAKAQCPKEFQESDFNEIVDALDRYRPNLKTVRQWARNNDRSDIELASNRLEYWSKDVKRYILKHKNSHTNKVCERLFNKEFEYFGDFIKLTLFYKRNPNAANVNFKKYK